MRLEGRAPYTHKREWRVGPRPGLDLRLDYLTLFAKDEPSQLVAQLFDLPGFAGITEAIGQLEKGLLFLPSGFDALFDEFHQNAIIAKGPPLCEGLDLFSDFGGQSYAAANLSCASPFCACHCSTSIHHFGASLESRDARAILSRNMGYCETDFSLLMLALSSLTSFVLLARACCRISACCLAVDQSCFSTASVNPGNSRWA